MPGSPHITTGPGRALAPAVPLRLLPCARPAVTQVAMGLFACLCSAPLLPGSQACGLRCPLGPLHHAKGAFLIFTGMKTFPKSKGLGGFEEFPLEMK